MKKYVVLLFSVVTVIGISPNTPRGNLVYASNVTTNVSEGIAVFNNSTEQGKAEFAYEMAQITAKIVSAPVTNTENFKVEFAYAIAKVTAKVMPILPSNQRNEFAYEMAQVTAKIVSDQNLNIEKAKAEFAYEIAQLTTKIITNTEKISTATRIIAGPNNNYIEPKTAGTVAYAGAEQNTMLLRNNADIEQRTTAKVNNIDIALQPAVNTGYIAPETYTGLIDGLTYVGDRSQQVDNKVKINGELRLHYALNSGTERWGRDSSGLRLYLGADTAINKDWRVYGMLEGQKSIVNYNNTFKLSRLYAAGKVGASTVKAGSFGYLMAEGNIYDSGFKGVKWDFGDAVKYTFSVGETDYTKNTTVATARYNDFDYNVEAGAYHYQLDGGVNNQNTILTLGGNYYFSNFSVGAMALSSRLKDSNGDNKGYVLSLNYGDLKTYRPGTYEIFAKYYNQPKGTYIMHGMNAAGGSMQGFKGYGFGTHYTISKDFVGGIEYYNLTDKTTGESGQTWWSQLNHYF